MTPAALIRDDTLETLVLDGCLSIGRANDGSITRNAVPDRTYVADGITVQPAAITIEALISQSPGTEGATTGPERINEVIEYLSEARRVGATLSLQQPGRALDVDLVVERWSDRSDRSDAPALTIVLGQVRIAVKSTIVGESTKPKTPPVPSETAKGGEVEREGGRRSLLSIGIDDFTGFFLGGGEP
jgi:hypothetical protein